LARRASARSVPSSSTRTSVRAKRSNAFARWEWDEEVVGKSMPIFRTWMMTRCQDRRRKERQRNRGQGCYSSVHNKLLIGEIVCVIRHVRSAYRRIDNSPRPGHAGRTRRCAIFFRKSIWNNYNGRLSLGPFFGVVRKIGGQKHCPGSRGGEIAQTSRKQWQAREGCYIVLTVSCLVLASASN
jgi:hypothetical protein